MAQTDYLQGYLATQQGGIEARNDITVAIRNWFANRNPLYTRLAHVPVERVDFYMYTHKYRTRSTTLAVAISSTGQTTLTLANASEFMNHDVLMLTDGSGNYERAQITADPTITNTTTGAGTVTVTRGIASTGALSASAIGQPVALVGNARTGAEVDQTGLVSYGQYRQQWCQTFQFPVQVGGSAQTTRAAVLPGGIASPFDFNRTIQLQNMVDDIEVSIYSGIGQAPVDSTTTIAMMNGIAQILETNNIGGSNSNVTQAAPTNAAAYRSTDLVRDTLQACRTGGGEPDLLVVSTDFMSAFQLWGQSVMRVPAGETTFGTPISTFEAPFLNGVTIVEAPLLKSGTVICLTSSEVYIRPKRNAFWNPRGVRGDMIEGDWIAELAVEMVNESHHAYVSGITNFSAS